MTTVHYTDQTYPSINGISGYVDLPYSTSVDYYAEQTIYRATSTSVVQTDPDGIDTMTGAITPGTSQSEVAQSVLAIVNTHKNSSAIAGYGANTEKTIMFPGIENVVRSQIEEALKPLSDRGVISELIVVVTKYGNRLGIKISYKNSEKVETVNA